MAGSRHGLTARKVETAPPGKYEDGHGLRLVVSTGGARRWVYRYMRDGRRMEMGLGSASAIGLAEARELAGDARRVLTKGGDPLAVRRAERAAALEIDRFGDFAQKLIDSIEEGFRNAKHRAQWRSTLVAYAVPIWSKRLSEIDTDDVLQCLTPIWQKKP
ncbi:Arm DNA-binding domain-containing protein [Rhodoplanes sp.]|uniref:Arm DNA-binding domain-containing protein n=1 Tax=Rhodoplanes sp. TaxID=1968906 RepID=UPI00345BD6EC